jgi:hypothetical protein
MVLNSFNKWCYSYFKGLFGSGDIPKWLGIATEKLVAKCLVQRIGVVVDSQILGIYP